MAHQHNHCKHQKLEFCRDCRLVHCLDCKQEWSHEPCKKAHYELTQKPWFPYQQQFLSNIQSLPKPLSEEIKRDLASFVNCSHKE